MRRGGEGLRRLRAVGGEQVRTSLRIADRKRRVIGVLDVHRGQRFQERGDFAQPELFVVGQRRAAAAGPAIVAAALSLAASAAAEAAAKTATGESARHLPRLSLGLRLRLERRPGQIAADVAIQNPVTGKVHLRERWCGDERHRRDERRGERLHGLTSTSSSASRLGPSIITARVSPSL